MPSDRTKAIEKIVIREFLKSFNDTDKIQYPDPPDALLYKKDGNIRWIEVSTVYRDEIKPKNERMLAKNLYSGAPGKPYHENLGEEGKQED